MCHVQCIRHPHWDSSYIYSRTKHSNVQYYNSLSFCLDNKKLLSKTAERSPSGDHLYLEVLRPVTVFIAQCAWRMARLRFTGHYALLANFHK